MANVVFDRVVKRYGNNPPVIKELNLRVEDKEFLVLVGPSGCGKSTALRMIAGLEEISGGYLSIGDQVVNDVHPKNRDIAMVFQNYALYPHMSNYENMAFALKLRKVPAGEIKQRVMEAAKSLEVEHLLDRKPKELSGGQRQRIAIGRAIVREPKVFLMDEPLSNLDAKLRVSMRAEIKKLHQRLQTTFVYVTHDQTEAMTLGDRIAIMKSGDLQQCDTPHEVYNFPANLFVATFIGSPQMNLMAGELARDGEQAVVTGPGFRFVLPMRPSYQEGAVIVGVRPEHLSPAGAETTNLLTSTVEVIEPMGFETYVYLTNPSPGTTARSTGLSKALIARVTEATPLRLGEALTLKADPAKIHLFDPESENRLA
jgi:multiple sugar transport system ATP-binding protein